MNVIVIIVQITFLFINFCFVNLVLFFASEVVGLDLLVFKNMNMNVVILVNGVILGEITAMFIVLIILFSVNVASVIKKVNAIQIVVISIVILVIFVDVVVEIMK